MSQLGISTLFALSKLYTKRLQLCLVERVGQRVEHVLRAATLSLAHEVGILAVQQVREYLRLTPDVVIDQPLHQLAHRLRPGLIVEHPEYAASFPGRVQGALAEIP